MYAIGYAVALVSAKMLAAYSYHSTDFEVHRNWMAITSKLPMEEWYYENTSMWTLDYPPVFAYLERVLAVPATFLDPKMTEIESLSYTSHTTVLYQRFTVALGDAALFFAVFAYLKRYLSGRQLYIALCLVVCNPGLFIVDSVHFQYNSLLYAGLTLSIVFAQQNQFLWCALTFTVVLCAKHIFLYMAPAFFIYLLRRCVWDARRPITAFIALGATVVGTAGVCIAPFVLHLPQVLSRMFPWGRGLCHAYWAPNFYALYNLADLVLQAVDDDATATPCTTCVNTRGLVDTYTPGSATHVLLPSLSPLLTNVVTLAAVVAIFIAYWRGAGGTARLKNCGRMDTSGELVWLCALCSAAFFGFSWHVHEKAILMVSVPLTLLVGQHDSVRCVIANVLAVGTLTLFPLLFEIAELPLKLSLALAMWFMYPTLLCSKEVSLYYGWVDRVLVILTYLAAIYQGVHSLLPWGARFPFLPLMALSVVGAASLMLSFARLFITFKDAL